MKMFLSCVGVVVLAACSPGEGTWERPVLLSGTEKQEFIEFCESEGLTFQVIDGSSSCVGAVFSSPRFQDKKGVWRESRAPENYYEEPEFVPLPRSVFDESI